MGSVDYWNFFFCLFFFFPDAPIAENRKICLKIIQLELFISKKSKTLNDMSFY